MVENIAFLCQSQIPTAVKIVRPRLRHPQTMETQIWYPSSLDTIHTPSECYTEKLASCCRLAQWS